MNIISRLTARFLAWHLKPTDAQNYDFLDGLRGLAILLVIACHFLYVNPHSNIYVQFIGGIFAAGGCGVALFFCLSGYLVSLPFWKRKLAGKTPVVPTGYSQRRFFKIYPPLVLSILLFTPIYIYIGHDPSYLVAAAEWLVGAPILFPVDGRFNPVMWSLIVEVQFYILLPVVMLLFRDISMRKSIWIIPLVFASIGACFRYVFLAFKIHLPYPITYVPLLSGLDAFTMGVLVGGLYAMGFIRKSWAKIGNVGLLILFVMLPVISFLHLTQKESGIQTEAIDFILKIAFGCMLFLVADAECFATRLLCNPLLRWFGIVSYEWYLFHQAIFLWFKGALGPANGSPLTYLLIVGGSFVASLLLAALVYKYFSLPILIYARTRHKPIDK
jgi:peptidoglycan/LPS O-acetylase OafA/YrhL